MTGFLIDTNVVAELTRDTPDARVIAFLADRDDLWLSSIVIHELEYGIRLLPQGQRHRRLRAMNAGIVSTYADRILPLDRAGAEWAARFRAQARGLGRTLDLGDALIAGTARANDITVATRNIGDFEYLEIGVVNPWESR